MSDQAEDSKITISKRVCAFLTFLCILNSIYQIIYFGIQLTQVHDHVGGGDAATGVTTVFAFLYIEILVLDGLGICGDTIPVL